MFSRDYLVPAYYVCWIRINVGRGNNRIYMGFQKRSRLVSEKFTSILRASASQLLDLSVPTSICETVSRGSLISERDAPSALSWVADTAVHGRASESCSAVPLKIRPTSELIINFYTTSSNPWCTLRASFCSAHPFSSSMQWPAVKKSPESRGRLPSIFFLSVDHPR